MIRVLNIHWGFIPGGVARYASLINDVSQKAPIEMISICINVPHWPFDEILAAKVNMKFISIRSRFDLSWFWKVKDIIRKVQPDLLLTYGFNGNIVAVTTTIGQNISIISTWHGKYIGTSGLQKLCSPLINFVSDFLLKYFVNHIITVSDYSKNVLMKHSIKKSKIKRIYNGIPPIENKKVKNEKNHYQIFPPHKELTIGTVCRLDSTKDLPTLLKAIKLVSNETESLKLVIYGEGPLKQYLKKMAESLYLQNTVTFCGYQSNIAECLGSLDIFILTSKLENFSIALLEAMRSGLPIIATRVGGNPEAIEDNKHGILIPPKAPELLAKAIIRFARDKILQQKMGKAAYQRFLVKFTKDKMVTATARFIVQCASTSAS